MISHSSIKCADIFLRFWILYFCIFLHLFRNGKQTADLIDLEGQQTAEESKQTFFEGLKKAGKKAKTAANAASMASDLLQ